MLRPEKGTACYEEWQEYADYLEIEGAKLEAQLEERTKADFVFSFSHVQRWAYRIARMKGFHDKARSPGEAIALIHSEASELLEVFRKDPDAMSPHIEDHLWTVEELADIIIRAMDMAEEFLEANPGDMERGEGVVATNLGMAIMSKIQFNAKRPKKHGGKKF